MTLPSPSTEGLVDHIARAICWKFSEETNDCSSVCLNAKKCMADAVDPSFIRDARAALEASGHTALLREIEDLKLDIRMSLEALEKGEATIEETAADLAALSRPL